LDGGHGTPKKLIYMKLLEQDCPFPGWMSFQSPYTQGDHSTDTRKFPDISLTMCGTHAHDVKWY